MTTCLITGVGGFCARHVVARLEEEGGFRVVGTGLRAQPPAGIRLDDYLPADVCERGALAAIVRKTKPDWVLHLAGLREGTDADVQRVNVAGSGNLLEALRQDAPQARVLLIGTAAEYGFVDEADLPVTEQHPCQPAGAYATSKHEAVRAGLELARRDRLKVVVARPFNVIGPGLPPSLVLGAVLSQAARAAQAAADPVVRVGNLDAQRDFVAVGDVADAYVRMLRGDYWGEVFNLCSGRPYEVRAAVELLLARVGRPVRLQVDPARVRRSEVRVSYGSYDKARRAFGFAPATSVEESIRAMWDHAMREAA
ncbi:MAG: NAD-dependent epimerase/dehydratase family protein [Nitrospiraceae bacterium]